MLQGRIGGRSAVWVMVVLLAAMAAVMTEASAARAETSTVISQWRFDEAGGQKAIDDGPFGLDGRLGLSDAADDRDPARVPGLSGRALRFDGRSFVRLPNAAELEPATLALEAVIRAPSSPGRFRYVVVHGAQGCTAGSYGLYTADDGGLAFYVYDGVYFRVTAAVGPGEIWNGGWHHVAGVFSGNTIRFYVDGHPVGAPLTAPPTIAYTLASSDTYFGIYQGTCALPLKGDIDLVRLWNGPLAPDTVGTLSDETLAPPTADPGPDTIPTTDQAGSDGDAAGSRSTITPVAEGISVPSRLLPTNGTAPTGTTPNAPARACVVRASAKRVRAGKRTSLTVRVRLRGKPLSAVRIIATEVRSRARLATAKTTKNGNARLHLKPRRHGTIKLIVQGRTDCSSAALTVLKQRKK